MGKAGFRREVLECSRHFDSVSSVSVVESEIMPHAIMRRVNIALFEARTQIHDSLCEHSHERLGGRRIALEFPEHLVLSITVVILVAVQVEL